MRSTPDVTVDRSLPRSAVRQRRLSLQRAAGWLAIGSGGLFLANSVIEYRFGLFPDAATGGAEIANQVGFSLAMIGWVGALILILRSGVAGQGPFARLAISLQASGLLALVVASFTVLGSGRQDSALFPFGGMAMMAGGLLTGVSLALPGRLHGWHRVAAATSGIVPVLVTFALISGPNFAIEALWPGAWIALGAALLQDANVRVSESRRARP